ncbi:MAG: TetR/AcrR family transcriptional regulator [Gammaproteobacteria bacterium]|nr:TetR/AcrR family transcriptional regulator [Gammaproteobacteria bacterium]
MVPTTRSVRPDVDQGSAPAMGRPPSSAGLRVKAALLEAARRQFLSREFGAVSVRAIADDAGVNGAMVNYYFGSKEGLYLAMADELLAAFDEGVTELSERDEVTITAFTEVYHRLVVANPWWPNFLVREVIFGEGSIRDAIAERFAAQLMPRLVGSIDTAIQSGEYRSDLNPYLATLSIMSMTLFPFIVRPLFERVAGIELGASRVDEMIEHTSRLFLHGATTHANPVKPDKQPDSTAPGERP